MSNNAMTVKSTEMTTTNKSKIIHTPARNSRFIITTSKNGRSNKTIWSTQHALALDYPATTYLIHTAIGLKVISTISDDVYKVTETALHEGSSFKFNGISISVQKVNQLKLASDYEQNISKSSSLYAAFGFGELLNEYDAIEQDYIGTINNHTLFVVYRENNNTKILAKVSGLSILVDNEEEANLEKGQAIQIDHYDLNNLKIKYDEYWWKFNYLKNVNTKEIDHTIFSTDQEANYFKKLSYGLLLSTVAFIFATAVGIINVKKSEVKQEYIATKIQLKQIAKAQIKKPEPKKEEKKPEIKKEEPKIVEVKKETVKPEKKIEKKIEKKLVEKKKPEPKKLVMKPLPKSAPPMPKIPTPIKKVEQKIVKKMPPLPMSAPPAPKVVKLPPKPSAAKPAPVVAMRPFPMSAPPAPKPAVVQPTAAQLKAQAQAKVAQSLGFLSAATSKASKNPAAFAADVNPNAKYQAMNAASALNGKANNSTLVAMAGKVSDNGSIINTRSSRSIAADAGISGAHGKGLNDVQGKVSLATLYDPNAGESMSSSFGGQGLQMSGAGSISESELMKILSKYLSRFQYCYEKALLTNATLSGNLTMQWTIQTSGHTSDVKVIRSQLNNASVHSCMSAELSKIAFPSPKGGSITIKYPFAFTSTAL